MNVKIDSDSTTRVRTVELSLGEPLPEYEGVPVWRARVDFWNDKFARLRLYEPRPGLVVLADFTKASDIPEPFGQLLTACE